MVALTSSAGLTDVYLKLYTFITKATALFTSLVILNSCPLLVRLRLFATALIQLRGRDVTVRSP